MRHLGIRATVVLSAWAVTTWAISPSSARTKPPDTDAGRAAAIEPAGIVGPQPSTFAARLAAKEIRRYVYLRTGRLLPLANNNGIITLQVDTSLQPQQYRLRSDGKTLTISGGSDIGVLYGAYTFIEKLGVRFYLHGDVIPDEQIAFKLPQLDEVGKPLFAVRGIQPFHDFPEGPDWWNTDDYKAYVAQLAKMKMNFIGMHTYPEGGPFAEPLVWIGLPDDVNADGTVKFAYHAHWASTMTTYNDGCVPVKTSDFTDGAGELFPRDDYTADVLKDLNAPMQKPEASIAIFNRVGKQMNEVFAAAKRVGVKTCIGTETPITIPAAVKRHLKQLGKDPADPKVVKELYAGMMKRINLAMPADYYWLWTPEPWTWSGNNPAQFEATCRDIQAAYDAVKESEAGMRFATSGWVLGPQHDRAALNAFLPKDVAMACINRNVGHEGVEPAFAALDGRSRWAIPWMENDPNMVAYQPWVARMRYDAADAKRFGCDGLLGIHWRTKILSQNVSALAHAEWDQSYVPASFNTKRVKPDDLGPGGSLGVAPGVVAGADVPEVYHTLRWNLKGYKLSIPNGTYQVTLKFVEIAYNKPGVRVFDVKVQGKMLAEKFDIVAASGGKLKAIDLTAKGVRVQDGILRIDFHATSDFACISGIAIEGTTDAANQVATAPYVRKIHCGGSAVAGYEADLTSSTAAPAGRAMPVGDFYADFAHAQFGPEIGEESGKLLAALDGEMKVSDWGPGPGALRYDAPARSKALVAQFAALRPKVVGAGNLARFDYWQNTLQASVAMGNSAEARGALGGAMNAANGEKDPTKKLALVRVALEKRIALARSWDALMQRLIAACDTPGELGTIANLEQHTRVRNAWLTGFDTNLVQLLGKPLPAECEPAKTYAGPARLTVLTVRGSALAGEKIKLPIIALDNAPVQSVVVHVRPLGRGEWTVISAAHVARAVYEARLPAAQDDFEYYVTTTRANGDKLNWPATAPTLNQTVVVTD